MIQSANKYQISEIFNVLIKAKYVIPKYQREYVWGKEQQDALFNDLMENEEGHFLGSIICIDQGNDPLDIIPLEVVDGQQRLTTISLLFSAIYSRLQSENRTDDDDFIALRNNLKYSLIQKSDKYNIKLELSYQNNNFQDYQAILQELKLITIKSKPLNLGNRRIYRTYQNFKNKVSELSYEDTIKLLDKINSAVVVKIQVNSHSDAYILFESLNNRGIPLTAIDLIKNKFLAVLEKKGILNVEDAFNQWNSLINNLPDYAIQERFLRQYYNAFVYKYVQGCSIKATKSNLIKLYERLIENDVKNIFDELVEKSNLYRMIASPDDDSNPYYEQLLDLIHIGSAPSYTFLMYLFNEQANNKELINKTLEFLAKYFIRRNLTDYPATRDLDTIFIGLIEECRKNENNLSFPVIRDFLTSLTRFADDRIFEERLRGNIYEDNTDVARFILCKIEEHHQSKEIYSDLWSRDKSEKYIWTIEHIFPEGENIPDDWVNMIAQGDKTKAKELQIEWVHRIGNLTLTGYNSNLSNLSFEKKRDRKDKNGNLIGYKNGLYLNEDLKDKDAWEVNDIQQRTEYLVKLAMDLVKI